MYSYITHVSPHTPFHHSASDEDTVAHYMNSACDITINVKYRVLVSSNGVNSARCINRNTKPQIYLNANLTLA
jgi:hypothetical protein